jgi:solute carrier family 8 (sodium/calcium exchanger)
MAAIEVITSQEREVTVKKANGDKKVVLVRIWNETVSNLTLMALGSSAPEILLSVIEICGNKFEAGDLGPGTIIGSAAFNLFIIIAVCIISVPPDDIRKIQKTSVFYVTVVWSTFAYIWLYLILSVFSPNVVEVWESVLTFFFFFLTVVSAYVANIYSPMLNREFLKRPPTSFGDQHQFQTSFAGKPQYINESDSPKLDFGTDLEATEKFMQNGDNTYDDFLNHRRTFYEIFKKIRAEHPVLFV